MNTEFRARMPLPKRLSYVIMALILLAIAFLHLATPILVALFAYFALSKLHFSKNKWVAVCLFTLLVSGLSYILVHFSQRTVRTLPAVIEKAVPKVIEEAERFNVELTFTDYKSLKEQAVKYAKDHVKDFSDFATIVRNVSMQVLFLVIGCVVAVSVFLNAQFELDRESMKNPTNLYSACCDEISLRFAGFFDSFSTVMGAQILISLINTTLTAAFVIIVGMPHPIVITGVTFLCGLLPVIGNLISNTIIVSIGLTVSPGMAVAALAYLVIIHKLEYFLNSKIIGTRIRNPIWLTLIGLVLGEKLMGIPGIILAPVVLHYFKVEVSKITVAKHELTEPVDPQKPPASEP